MKRLLVFAATCALFCSTATVMAAGDPVAGKQKSAPCAACHNADGNSTNPEWPKLAGQNVKYSTKQLLNFKAGNDPDATIKRVNAIMNGMAAPLSEQDMDDISAYYASQAITPAEADPDLVALGEAIYRGGNLTTGMSACTGCHQPNGTGNPAAGFPSLAGQHAQYIETQLKAFRSMERANDPGQMMRNIAMKMTDAEIKAVASYIQGLR
ncbi:MAG: c-type cytochrome [Candidatus Competibacteraceae bacterium]|nr:c-type cytochrome [Candidatus Competibacteraceae bacterium]